MSARRCVSTWFYNHTILQIFYKIKLKFCEFFNFLKNIFHNNLTICACSCLNLNTSLNSCRNCETLAIFIRSITSCLFCTIKTVSHTCDNGSISFAQHEILSRQQFYSTLPFTFTASYQWKKAMILHIKSMINDWRLHCTYVHV